MSNRKRPHQTNLVNHQPSHRFRSILLGSTTALVVAAPLIASESAERTGSSTVLCMLWILLLLAFSFWAATQKTFCLRFGPVDAALLLLVLIAVGSAVMMASQGNARYTTNALWQWMALACGYFLIRQLLRTAVEHRAIWLVMIALSASLAAHGLLQYSYTFPQRQKDYQQFSEQQKQDALWQQGIDPTLGSPSRKHFEDRLAGKGPTATFALTNSLAGLLAPWVMATLGLLLLIVPPARKKLNRSLGDSQRWPARSTKGRPFALFLLGLVSLIVLFCLLLTKSRSGYLAAGLGALLLWYYDWRTDRRIGWKIPAILLVLLIVLVVGAVAVGGIDAQLLTQAKISMSYRLEYWRSTVAMIGDHWLLGCGPGNFKEFYTTYKLPQASEEISDPHNFILEVWATAGTLALVAMFVVAGLLLQSVRGTAVFTDGKTESQEPSDFSHRAIYFGALVGLICTLPLSILAALPLETIGPVPAIWLVGLPLGLAVFCLLDGWVCQGKLPPALIIIVLVVLLVNLMVAGGFGFMGVAQSLWLLWAMIVNRVEGSRYEMECSKRKLVPLMMLGILLVVSSFLTGYVPVLQSSTRLEEGNRFQGQGHWENAKESYFAAAVADRRCVKPWIRLAELELARWRAISDDARHDPQVVRQFEELLDRYVEQIKLLDRKSSATRRQMGGWYLELFRTTDEINNLKKSVDSFREAARLYPNSNMAHAQLAWVLQLAGSGQQARSEAKEAIRLDAVLHHSELKLNRRRILDPGPLEPTQRDKNAEELMQWVLQNGSI